MSEKFFLYIDILGFKELVRSGFDMSEIFRRIDSLNVHRDRDFKCIVFSDTIIVYSSDAWMRYPNQALMWLIEFAQDLFYRFISLDVHIRAYVTKGEFEHQTLENVEAYYGAALIDCYEREKQIKCTGVFLDSRLAAHSDIFHLSPYDDECHYVHVMQNLRMISAPYDSYPIDGYELSATGMEYWSAYELRYLHNVWLHMTDTSLSEPVRLKYRNTWRMISSRHEGLLRNLAEKNFVWDDVIEIDWSEPFERIGTDQGAFD